MEMVDKDLSEPYSIFTYRYFLCNWPGLCIRAVYEGELVIRGWALVEFLVLRAPAVVRIGERKGKREFVLQYQECGEGAIQCRDERQTRTTLGWGNFFAQLYECNVCALLCHWNINYVLQVGVIICKAEHEVSDHPSDHDKTAYRGYIAMLAVSRTMRRRGLGTALVLHAVQSTCTNQSKHWLLLISLF